jgi:hypothetical protein
VSSRRSSPTFGDRYHPHDLGTVDAGSIVGEVMRHLGYELAGRKDMPEGSVAKTRPKIDGAVANAAPW